MGLPSEMSAPEGALGASSPRRREWLWAPALVLPYLGLVGGAVLLVGVREQAFGRLWWLSVVAVLAYLILLAITIVSLTRRLRRANDAGPRLQRITATLNAVLTAHGPDRRQLAEGLLDRLPEVAAVSRGLSEPERAILHMTLKDVGAPAIVERRLAQSRTKWRRAAALQTLGWLADERSIPTLQAALRGRDPELAYVAGQSLAEYDSPRACGCLVDALRTGWPSRGVIATLLESARYPDSASLVAAESAHSDPNVRSWVAYLLGRSQTPAAATVLGRLACDSKAAVRASAAEALSAFPDEALLRNLLRDRDWAVRANAAKAIGEAGGPAPLVADLATLLHDRVWWVRQKATISLKLLGAASIEPLIVLLEGDDMVARTKAAEILIEVGHASSQIDALLGGPGDRANANAFLRRLARAGARATITANVGSSDPLIGSQLTQVLSDVGESTDARDRSERPKVASPA